MKKFSDYIEEATVIKLRGFGNEDRSKHFVRDLHATSKPHPLNHRARIIGHASVEVSHGHDGIHLHDIYSHEPESGAGTKALKHLTKLADKHNVPIHGFAKAYSDGRDGHINKNHHLNSWYEKHGFKTGRGDSSGKHISYHPKKD